MPKRKTIFDLDLVKIGRRYRQVFWCLLGAIVALLSYVGLMSFTGTGSMPVQWGVTIFLWVVNIASIVFMVRLQSAMGVGVLGLILCVVLTFFLSFLVILATLSKAATILRLAGAKVGFAGVSDNELAKLQPGHCRGCGYDRAGLELLQACPECTRVPMVI